MKLSALVLAFDGLVFGQLHLQFERIVFGQCFLQHFFVLLFRNLEFVDNKTQ